LRKKKKKNIPSFCFSGYALVLFQSMGWTENAGMDNGVYCGQTVAHLDNC